MSYIGDRPFGQTVYAKFTTVNASGVPTTLGNTPSLAYMVDNDTTLYTSGLALTADYASKTGLNAISAIVTTSCTGMVSGTDVQVIVAAGTVSAVSMIGYVVAEFSINKSSALKPATATRTLAVNSSGGAAIDWGQVSNPTTANNLSGTTVNLVNTLTTYTGNTPQTGDVFARVGAAGSGLTAIPSVGSVTGAVGSVTNPVTVGTNNDKTGYSLTQTFPANFAALTVSASGFASADVKKVNAVTVNGAGTSGSPWGP